MYRNVFVTLCCVFVLPSVSLLASTDCLDAESKEKSRSLVKSSVKEGRLSDFKKTYKGLVVSVQDILDASKGNQKSIDLVEQFWKRAPWYDEKSEFNDVLVGIGKCVAAYKRSNPEISKTDENGMVCIPCKCDTEGGVITCLKLTPEELETINKKDWFDRLLNLNETDVAEEYKVKYAVSDYLNQGALTGDLAALAKQFCDRVLCMVDRVRVSAAIQRAGSGSGDPEVKLTGTDEDTSIEFKNITDFWGQKVNVILRGKKINK